MNTQIERDLCATYHTLILGALKRYNITSRHTDFDDYLQQARIELLLTHRMYEESTKKLPDFRPYVFQKICWSTSDLLRKEKNICTKSDYIEIQSIEHNLKDDSNLASLHLANDLYDSLSALLLPTEKIYLDESFFDNLTISQIACKHKVSRKTVYKWRDGVRKKYQILEKKG